MCRYVKPVKNNKTCVCGCQPFTSKPQVHLHLHTVGEKAVSIVDITFRVEVALCGQVMR